jgi:hypothetical protein
MNIEKDAIKTNIYVGLSGVIKRRYTAEASLASDVLC